MWRWEATQLTPEERRNGRLHIKSKLVDVRNLHGPQTAAESNSPTKLVDQCLECFKDAPQEEKLDQMMKDLKFQQVGVKFGGFLQCMGTGK